MIKKDSSIIFITKAAVIAALYISIGLIFKGWDFGNMQLRPAEALCALIYFTPSAPYGLFIGCVINNLSSPYGLLDIVLGSATTLAAGLAGRRIRNKYLCLLPSVVFNAVSVPFIICFSSGTFAMYPVFFAQIFFSQTLSVYIFGIPLIYLIDKNKRLKEYLR